MVASPGYVPGAGDDPLVARLVALEKAVANIARKTLYSTSIGAGGVTITNGGGLTVSGGNLSLADPAGDPLLANDQAIGPAGSAWGLAQPNISTAFYAQNSDTATQNNTNDSNWYSKFVTGHVINHPKVHFGVRGSKTSAAGGNYRVQWYTTCPLDLANPAGGTLMASGAIVNRSVSGDITYSWPTNMFGQVVFVSYEVQMTAGVTGSDFLSATPAWFYGTGING